MYPHNIKALNQYDLNINKFLGEIQFPAANAHITEHILIFTFLDLRKL